MALTFESFAFVFTLAAVINGLGIVRWVTGFSEYLRRDDQIAVEHYWVFNLFAAVQFLMHILLWWSLWGVRTAETFNFLSYLFLLTGPILLFLGSSLLMPDFASDAALNIREHYARVRRLYATVYAAFWLWVIFLWPVMKGVFAPTVPFLAVFMLLAILQRQLNSPKAHAVIAVLNALLIVVVIALFSLQLGAIAERLD